MATLTEQNERIHTVIHNANIYSSRMMRSYISWLSKRRNACILDLGPVCDDTVNFFLPHVKKIFLYDVFLRLSRHQDTHTVLQNLDYKPNSFDAIHLWDLINHLESNNTSLLLKVCYSLLKPGGSVIITAYDEFKNRIPLNSFAVNKNYQVVLRPQHHLDLPYFHRNNRDISLIMSQFNLCNSYVYKCGVREFYFRRD